MLPSSIKLIYFDPLGGHLHLPPPPSNLFPYLLIPSPLSPLLISPPLVTKCSQMTAYLAPLPHLTKPFCDLNCPQNRVKYCCYCGVVINLTSPMSVFGYNHALYINHLHFYVCGCMII